MQQYLDLLQDVLDNGEERQDRTGTGTLSVFGRQARYDLREGFPCLTTKKLHLRSIIHELLWFLKGDTNIAYLKENGVRIWDEWADENGDLGPVYGQQWRSWAKDDGSTIDQIARLIHDLKHNPHSRRHLVSAWNVGKVDEMALPPCHLLFQFYVHEPLNEGGKSGLSCQLYQRSADLFLGVPFNIASYALFTMMIAQVLGYEARDFVHSFGDLTSTKTTSIKPSYNSPVAHTISPPCGSILRSTTSRSSPSTTSNSATTHVTHTLKPLFQSNFS